MVQRDGEPPTPDADTGAAHARQASGRPPGRPPRRLPAVARYTIRLDAGRHGALMALAEADGDRSLHSLVLQAIDDFIRKRGRAPV